MKVVSLLRLLLGPLNIRRSDQLQCFKFDLSCLLPLHNDDDIVNMFKFNDVFYHVYISQCTECGDDLICPTSGPIPIVASNSAHVSLLASPHYTSLMSRPQFSHLGDSNIVQVHTFRNVHNHCLEDVALSQPLVRSTRASLVIDDVIRSTPEYQPRQISTAYDANDSMFPLVFGVMSSENYEDWLWFLEKPKIVVRNKEVIIISDRHPALLRNVPKVFGIENHAYCYRHLKENFSSFLSKHNTRGNKGKENALQFLDSIAYGRHHSICNFLLEYMSKLASMLVKHQEESKNWKGCIGPKIEAKVQENIAKGAVYPVTPFKNGVFGVCIGRALLNVDILNRTCTCRGWQMLGIPCEHAIAVIISIGQNVTDFVDDCYKYLMQELIYGGSFSDIETYDMPTVDDDGLVRSITGEVFFSLKPPHTKRAPERPRKKRIESQFQDKRTVYCSRYRVVADYALAEMGDPSEILCDMYEMYIRQEELSCLNAGRWVNSMIVAIVSRMMNGQQAPPARAHFFEPSFSVVLSNLKSNATTQVILERCAMYLDPDTLGHDLTGRVKILSSLPLRRGNNISAATRRLSMALHKTLHAYRIHMDADVSSFVHVQPHLLQQLNGSDCGVLVLKFMEFWNEATLTTSVAEDKMNMYRLQLVLQLVLNEHNSVRDTIMAACHL
ncbi:hypothetical protein CK203_073116 [Vitis vinifera]|uniref:SWIM-type domain-containing protein n=1 Tax=Vitis vinifera TaxID=29760 RepID=A0A438BXY4_VITVI|nr:hypothetical protein CK203_073116 [Vitis vinifera]